MKQLIILALTLTFTLPTYAKFKVKNASGKFYRSFGAPLLEYTSTLTGPDGKKYPGMVWGYIDIKMNRRGVCKVDKNLSIGSSIRSTKPKRNFVIHTYDQASLKCAMSPTKERKKNCPIIYKTATITCGKGKKMKQQTTFTVKYEALASESDLKRLNSAPPRGSLGSSRGLRIK